MYFSRLVAHCENVTVVMENAFGGGWYDNKMYLHTYQLSLSYSAATSETVTVCLQPGTYAPYVCGGLYIDRIGWTIYVAGEAVLSVAKGDEDSSCVNTAGSFLIGGVSPTRSPTVVPTVVPSAEPSSQPSATPTATRKYLCARHSN